MRIGRLAVVLASLLVVGIAGYAQANDGDPLILGQLNTATGATTLGGDFGATSIEAGQGLFHGSLEADQGSFLPPGGILHFSAGQQVVRADGFTVPCVDTAPCLTVDRFVVATVQGNVSDVWVASAAVHNRACCNPILVVTLNRPAPATLKVAFILEDSPGPGPE